MNIEELRAEFEAWRRKHYDYADLCAFEIEFAFDAFQAGRAALQSQDKEDAERYRWLRDSDGFYDLPYEDHGLGPEFPIGEALDAAIDHARRVEGEAK